MSRSIPGLAILLCTATALAAPPPVRSALRTAEAPLPGYSGAQLRRALDDVARLDRDRSGELDTEEVRALPKLLERFDDYDIDHSRTISPNEYQSWLAAQPSRRRSGNES